MHTVFTALVEKKKKNSFSEKEQLTIFSGVSCKLTARACLATQVNETPEYQMSELCT